MIENLQELRRKSFLDEAMTQLYARSACTVEVGTHDDVVWLRGELRQLGHREGWKVRTGEHHWLSTGPAGDLRFEVFTVWCTADTAWLAREDEVRASVERLRTKS